MVIVILMQKEAGPEKSRTRTEKNRTRQETELQKK